MTQDWITTDQAAAISDYHPEYIRELIRAGSLKAQKWGRSWQVSRSSLQAYLRAVEKLGERRGPKPGA